MEVNMIVAVGRNGEIGVDGNLIWRIPADLRRFKALTMGHPVIMGRNTWDSLPRRPLPGRHNIVVSRNPALCAEGAEVAASPADALRMAGDEEVFIMGGEQIYKAFMPYATSLYITEIEGECPAADARFPYPLESGEWQLAEATEKETTDGGVEYRYATYVRKK